MLDRRLLEIRLEGARSLLSDPDLSASDRDALERLYAELQEAIYKQQGEPALSDTAE